MNELNSVRSLCTRHHAFKHKKISTSPGVHYDSGSFCLFQLNEERPL